MKKNRIKEAFHLEGITVARSEFHVPYAVANALATERNGTP